MGQLYELLCVVKENSIRTVKSIYIAVLQFINNNITSQAQSHRLALVGSCQPLAYGHRRGKTLANEARLSKLCAAASSYN